jgi:hypothetical protein
MNQVQRIAVTACGLLAATAGLGGVFGGGTFIPPAAAVVGRPATPISVAGAARRTTRQVIRRSTIYAATLPVGCSTIYIEGAMIYQCGGTYYQPYNNQYVVVYID